ncbi:MAG: hypothetical protein EOO04_20830 [Chitinophagaceae bacterium]|nr:MAG: hypothetical protein EOO04_20830 [Chitinophagaceae bacterium]
MSSMEIPLYIYFIAISLLVSVVYNVQHRADAFYLKIFPFYLSVTFITELVSSYMWSHNMNNNALYNFFGKILFQVLVVLGFYINLYLQETYIHSFIVYSSATFGL